MALPDLGIERIKAKLDTGARTSALHAFDLRAFAEDGQSWVEFVVHPLQRNDAVILACRAVVLDRRWVTSSNGSREQRWVVATDIRIGERRWPIEITLTNRDEMGFRMLIGRSAMERHLMVDPAASYRAGRPRRRRVKVGLRRRRATEGRQLP